jgi:hypothetical protein
MRASQKSKSPNNIFIAAKTLIAIPVVHDLVRVALVQASLDPGVRAIEFISTVAAYGKIVELDAIILRRDAGRQVLDIPEVRPLRHIDDEGLALLASDQLGLTTLTMTAADLRQQPLASNAEAVWACRYTPIRASDRVRALEVLRDDGPMHLGRLSAELRWSTDPVGALLSLACLDLIELDLTSIPLGPETTVRRRIAEGETR